MTQEKISQIVEFVLKNESLKPDLIFTPENYSSGEQLKEIGFLSDIEFRKYGMSGVDESTKGILIFDYSKDLGVRTRYIPTETGLECANAQALTTDLLVKAEHFWDFKDFISRQNGLQIIFSNSNPIDFLPSSFPDSEDK